MHFWFVFVASSRNFAMRRPSCARCGSRSAHAISTVAFVNCDDVIQEITPATPYPTLCDSILPRTFERSADRIHPQGSNRCGGSSPYLASRSKMTNPGADPNGNASRNCCTIHELVGC